MYFTIRARIILLVSAGLGVLAVLVAVFLSEQEQTDRNIGRLVASMDKLEWASHLQLAVDKSLVPVNNYLINGEEVRNRADFRRLTAATENLLRRIEEPYFAEAEERIFLSKIRTDYERLKTAGEDILALSSPVGDAQGAALMERFDAMGAEIVVYLDQLHIIHEGKLKQSLGQTDSSRRQARQQLISGGAAAGILALLCGAWLARSLIQPIRELENGMQRIASGRWDHRVDIRTRDELEVLAGSLNSMAEKLGKSYRALETHAADFTELLETSANISAALEMEHLLALIPERLTRVLRTTYCRIALMADDFSSLVIRAAYPARALHWDPGVGRTLELEGIPDLGTALKAGQYVLLTKDDIRLPEKTAEREQLLTPATQSALLLPLFLKDNPIGLIILGEARSWEREPFTPEKIIICQTMANQAAVAFSNARNYENLQEMVVSTVTAMASAIDAKSPWTQGHSKRVTAYAVALGKRLNLDSVALGHLRLGCLLHDIGKIGTREGILDKPGRLTDEEMEVMEQHTVQGEAILRPIRQFRPILSVIRHHHERYDGTGYPDGLKGETIPQLARIAALADCFDSMVADRPYRKAPGRNEAIAEIKRCSGTQFDPSMAEVFVAMLGQADFGSALLLATENESFIGSA